MIDDLKVKNFKDIKFKRFINDRKSYILGKKEDIGQSHLSAK